MKRPKISICIPTYNRANLIGTTLQSVADQTVKPDEVIIIDNASTDNTQEIVKSYKKYGFKYIRNRKNIGMAGNLNKCIELASNELFTFLPSDDLIAPTWYADWTSVIAKHNAHLYTSPLTVFNNDYKPIWAFSIFKRSKMVKQPYVHKEFCTRYMPGLPPSAASVFRKSIFSKIRRFDPAEGPECDVRVGIRLFDICDVYYYHRRLFAFREHDMRSIDRKVEKRSNKLKRTIDRHFSILAETYSSKTDPIRRGRFFITIPILMTLSNINLYIVRGDIKTILYSYRCAFKYCPRLFRTYRDWITFIQIQLEFVKRGFMMYRISKQAKREIEWLFQIAKV